VTIIAGFRTLDGIVICGDTQETIGSLSKRNVAKVRVEPWYVETSGTVWRAVGQGVIGACFCGAGDGPFIDMLTGRLWDSVKSCSMLDEASRAAEHELKNAYREYGGIFQHGFCPSVDLIYGLKVGEESVMFHSVGPIVNSVETYCSAGIGYYMADFLASRMQPQKLDVYQCVVLAAYIILQAKEYVDGCGGESHIAVLRHKGRSGLVDRARIEAITTVLRSLDNALGDVLIAAADMRRAENVVNAIDHLTAEIHFQRTEASLAVERSDRFADMVVGVSGQDPTKDELGFGIDFKSE
jgi:hypothetical protein